MNNNFYGFSRCVYGVQGELVCERNTFFKENVIETFIEEKPNIPVQTIKPNESPNADIMRHAINNNYCDMSITSDAKTGLISQYIKKTCK